MTTTSLGVGSQIKHPKFGLGVIVEMDASFYKIYFIPIGETKNIARDFPNFELVEKVEGEAFSLTVAEVESAMENVLKRWPTNEPVPRVSMAQKWSGGTMILQPYNPSLSNKEIPISSFFKKIILTRERLRVLEQNINNHEKLDDQDKLHLQQYITRIYGSLTTFNVLFGDNEDYFRGSGKEE